MDRLLSAQPPLWVTCMPPTPTPPHCSYTVIKFHPLDDGMLHAGGWGGWLQPGAASAASGALLLLRCRHHPAAPPTQPTATALLPPPKLPVMTNEAQADVDFQFRLSPEETVRGRCGAAVWAVWGRCGGVEGCGGGSECDGVLG